MILVFLQGNIAKWVKKEGDKVSPGEVLCEVETVRFFICNVSFDIFSKYFLTDAGDAK